MRAMRDPTDEWLIATIGEAANPMVTLLDKLTDQQFSFCRAYVLCGSAKKAADKVGLSASQNPNLLIHLPKIAACINILTAKREAELGQKSAAEIVERLRNTPVLEEDDFGFSEEGAKEREAQLGADASKMSAVDADRLRENIQHIADDHGIMQLPKVRVSPAQSFGPQWIIERFVTVAERCLQIEPVFDRKGRPIGQFKFEPSAALKALEMLGKTMAMFRDRVEITHEYSGLTNEELTARLKALSEHFPEFKQVIDMGPLTVNESAT